MPEPSAPETLGDSDFLVAEACLRCEGDGACVTHDSGRGFVTCLSCGGAKRRWPTLSEPCDHANGKCRMGRHPAVTTDKLWVLAAGLHGIQRGKFKSYCRGYLSERMEHAGQDLFDVFLDLTEAERQAALAAAVRAATREA